MTNAISRTCVSRSLSLSSRLCTVMLRRSRSAARALSLSTSSFSSRILVEDLSAYRVTQKPHTSQSSSSADSNSRQPHPKAHVHYPYEMSQAGVKDMVTLRWASHDAINMALE